MNLNVFDLVLYFSEKELPFMSPERLWEVTAEETHLHNNFALLQHSAAHPGEVVRKLWSLCSHFDVFVYQQQQPEVVNDGVWKH